MNKKQIKELKDMILRFRITKEMYAPDIRAKELLAAYVTGYCDTKEKLGEVIDLLKEIQDKFDEYFKPREQC